MHIDIASSGKRLLLKSLFMHVLLLLGPVEPVVQKT